MDWNSSLYLQATGALKLQSPDGHRQLIVMDAQADPELLKAETNAHHKAIGSISGPNGTTSKCPVVKCLQSMIQEFSNGRGDRSMNPDEVIDGAAVQGAVLTGEGSSRVQDLLLVDVTPSSMGWWLLVAEELAERPWDAPRRRGL